MPPQATPASFRTKKRYQRRAEPGRLPDLACAFGIFNVTGHRPAQKSRSTRVIPTTTQPPARHAVRHRHFPQFSLYYLLNRLYEKVSNSVAIGKPGLLGFDLLTHIKRYPDQLVIRIEICTDTRPVETVPIQA